jgi:LCP family protein required for cell wall assembly
VKGRRRARWSGRSASDPSPRRGEPAAPFEESELFAELTKPGQPQWAADQTQPVPPGAGLDAGTAPPPPRPAARRRKKRHILRWVAVAVVAILGAGTLTVYLKYRQIDDSITRIPVVHEANRPPQYSTSSMNVLVFGSDSRAGLTPHEQYVLHTGSDQGNNTDTIMVIHISPGRHQVTALSIPRDTMVPMYYCAAGKGYPGQQQDLNQYVIINSLLAIGGPSCLYDTIEQQTGIFIDHFIEMGMLGFVNVVDDVGGVNVCVPFNVNDPVSGLRLPAGKDHITGVQALAFWRTREDIGTGSDLERIQRDQFMAAQIVKAVLGSDLLGNPLRLLHVVTDAAREMTTDSGMSASDLLSIAESFRSLSSKNVQFLTAPNEAYPAEAGRVQFLQPQADAVFSAIAHDITVPKTKAPSPGQTGGAQLLTTSPAKVKVEVLNGDGGYMVATKTDEALAADGFDVVGAADAATPTYTKSVIEYASTADMAEVNTLKQVIPDVIVQQDTSLTPGTIDLIVGSTFTGLITSATTGASASPSASASASPSASAGTVSNLAASNNGINASATCQSDAGAFAGPLSP